MRTHENIEEIFEQMGLGSSELRSKYTFQSLIQNQPINWEVKMTISGDTTFTQEEKESYYGGLEHNPK